MQGPSARETVVDPDIDFASLDLLPYGIIVVDEEGVVLYYNAREEQISGRSRVNVVGRNFFGEVAPCTQVRDFQGRFRETMEPDSPVSVFRFVFPFPGKPREVEITLTRFVHKGAALGLITVNDISEQALVRDRILRAERLREVGEVAAGVAHNFNNLLTVILGNAGLLLMNEGIEDDDKESLEAIRKAGEDGVAIVKRIAETTRPSHTLETLPRLDVRGVIDAAIEFVRPYGAAVPGGLTFTFRVESSGDGLHVRGVESELREVLVNLLRNAVDAMPVGGEIVARARREGGDVLVEIMDSGLGMTTAVKERLFLPLFTTKGDQGTGLGLATCYSLVRRHRGEILVRSAPGEGTKMTVRLPAV